LAYSGFLEAARIRDGLVVAYNAMYVRPSHTTPEYQTNILRFVFGNGGKVTRVTNDRLEEHKIRDHSFIKIICGFFKLTVPEAFN
jgi:hypothetical protein